MKKIFFIVLLISTAIYAENLKVNKDEIKKLIGQMIIVGFPNESVNSKSKIIRDINKYNLAGVILFDKFYKNRTKVKNIRSPEQLQLLTQNLQNLSMQNIIISIDQEGGKVQRLKSTQGFDSTPSAKKIAQKPLNVVKSNYKKMASMLSKNGINCNFAPIVDLSINQDNFIIEGLERSYGKSSTEVIRNAEVFIDTLKEKNIISVLKHFPGHGSSKNDSHKGFVDISDTWNQKELEPYKYFIKHNKADMIMTAHVFNKHLDSKYPATLSYKINTQLLRNQLGFQGVIISDDLQMKAISKHYTLDQTVTLAINSGVDILLFGNQLDNYNIGELIEVIFNNIQNGSIKLERIREANQRISLLLNQNR